MAVVKMEPIQLVCRCGARLESQMKMGIQIIALEHIREAHREAKAILDAYEEAAEIMRNRIAEFWVSKMRQPRPRYQCLKCGKYVTERKDGKPYPHIGVNKQLRRHCSGQFAVETGQPPSKKK